MNHIEAIGALAALAQESRLAVFRLLVKRGPPGYPVGEIGERLAIPGPTLSFHLKTLSQAGLVSVRRDGRFLRCSADFRAMSALLAYLTENCCGLGGACEPARATSETAFAVARPAQRRRTKAGRR